MPHAPDRALRRLVVELASLEPEDLSKVLTDLSSDERGSIERLLDEFAGVESAQAVPPGTAACDLARFSPWMVRRLLSDRFEGEMTPAGRTLLGACAAELCPALAPRRSRGAFARMANLFSGAPS